jgi:hypothetical protein
MLSLRDRLVLAPVPTPPVRGMLEGGGGLLWLYGDAEGVVECGGGSSCCCGCGCCCASDEVDVDEVLLKKDNLGDGRAGIGMNDFGGDGDCDCDDWFDCDDGLEEDLALRDDALVNDEADLVRLFLDFPFPFPLPLPPLPPIPRRWPEEDVDVGET